MKCGINRFDLDKVLNQLPGHEASKDDNERISQKVSDDVLGKLK